MVTFLLKTYCACGNSKKNLGNPPKHVHDCSVSQRLSHQKCVPKPPFSLVDYNQFDIRIAVGEE
jgi:hypothetical protein